jgi:type VI secretion system protein VasD
MMERRTVLVGLGGLALAATAGCVQAGPGAVTINATGAAGMNPGPAGEARPITLTVVQLRGTGAFDSADFFALQDPAAALGGDLVKADQIALAPGGTASKTISLDPGTAAVGIIAGYRDPAGKTFRARTAVSPKDSITLAVVVGPSGITLAAG